MSIVRDFRDKAVLVTGGTKGLGLATALAFARRGARCTLSYRWGSADEDEIRRQFAELGAPEPLIFQADAAEPEDTQALLEELRRRHEQIEVFVSNVAGAILVRGLEDMTERALTKTIRYSSWPTFEYIKRVHAVFGRYPRYVIAMSSNGPDAYNPNYDFVAASKAVLETLCRYATYRLRDEDIRINVVRASAIPTGSTADMFGEELFPFLERLAPAGFEFLTHEDVANVVVALTSGMLDAVRGQVIDVDRGLGFIDNLMRLYAEREALGI